MARSGGIVLTVVTRFVITWVTSLAPDRITFGGEL